jgi:hypothetical protein
MADDKKPQADATEQAAVLAAAPNSPAAIAAANAAFALQQAREEEAARAATESVPGGKYRTQFGDWVNAEGEPVKG